MAILKGIISKLNGSAGNLTFKQLGGPGARWAVPIARRAGQMVSEARRAGQRK